MKDIVLVFGEENNADCSSISILVPLTKFVSSHLRYILTWAHICSWTSTLCVSAKSWGWVII